MIKIHDLNSDESQNTTRSKNNESQNNSEQNSKNSSNNCSDSRDNESTDVIPDEVPRKDGPGGEGCCR